MKPFKKPGMRPEERYPLGQAKRAGTKSIADFILQNTYCCKSQQKKVVSRGKSNSLLEAPAFKISLPRHSAWPGLPFCIFAFFYLREQKFFELVAMLFASQSIQLTALATGRLSYVHVSCLISSCGLLHRATQMT